MKIRFLLAFFCFFCCNAWAQPKQEDYLVLQNGDTLLGKVHFYFMALNAQQEAIVPQRVHLKNQTYTADEVQSFQYRYQWGAAEKKQAVFFYSHPQFLDQDYFYEIVWRTDSTQLVRTYRMGYPGRRQNAIQFFHYYYFIQPDGHILVQITPENVRQLCQQYMQSETAFLAKMQKKKKKVLVYTPYTGLSKLVKDFLGK